MEKPITITEVLVKDVRFSTSISRDVSHAMNPDPDYSATYVIRKFYCQHKHFFDPVVIKNGAYMPLSMSGYSITMRLESLEEYSFPNGMAWKTELNNNTK